MPPVALIAFVADRPGHDARYAIDASKIARELGWHPLREFRQRIAQDGRVVSRQSRLVATRALRILSRRTPRSDRRGLSADGGEPHFEAPAGDRRRRTRSAPELAAEAAAPDLRSRPPRAELDVTDEKALAAAIAAAKPDAVINAAAWTAVDRAESEPERARAVNARCAGPAGRGLRTIRYSAAPYFDGLRL